MTRVRPPSLTVPLTVSLLTAAIVATANAQVVVDSAPKPVTGTAPIVSVTVANATSPGVSPVVGHVLRAEVTPSDPDGDAITGIDYAWKLDGAVVGTEQTYTPTVENAGAELVLEVTAHTDPDTTSPSSGSITTTVAIAANTAPVASGLGTSYAALVGNQIRGHYQFSDADNDLEGATRLQWYRADNASGTPRTAVAGATSANYTIQPADVGKWMVFEVTPVSRTGSPDTGLPVSHVRADAARYGSAPVASNAYVSGDLRVGSTLTAHYQYSDADGEPEGGTTFDWCWIGVSCGRGSASTYVVPNEAFGQQINVKIVPKSASGNPNTGTEVHAQHQAGGAVKRHLRKGTTVYGNTSSGSETGAPYRLTTGVFTINDARPMSDPRYRLEVWCNLDFVDNNDVELKIKYPGDSGFTQLWKGTCANGETIIQEGSIPKNGSSPSGEWNVDVFLSFKSGAIWYYSRALVSSANFEMTY